MAEPVAIVLVIAGRAALTLTRSADEVGQANNAKSCKIHGIRTLFGTSPNIVMDDYAAG